MKTDIKHAKDQTEFFTLENCYITELYNDNNDTDVSIAQARVKPEQTTEWHKLTNTTERYYILSGKGKVEVDGMTETVVEVGDVVIIPPSCAQRITNIGKCDLVFLAICSPRFKLENYQAIDGPHL